MARQSHRQEEEESGSDHTSEGHTYTPAPRQTFMDEDGVAIGFYIHKSVKKPDQRRNLTIDIENNGGIVHDTEDYADTVIIDEMRASRETLQLSYNCHHGRSQAAPIFVEPMAFVQRCIREGAVRHRLPLRQGMGGVVGRVRTSFTEEDDDNLCYYLSRVVPVREFGGRLGNFVYKELEKMGQLCSKEYPWVRRHPWQSWRERYKKHAERFDMLITQHAERHPPPEHVQYTRRRGYSSKHQGYVELDEVDNLEFSDSEDVNRLETRSVHGKRQRSGSYRASLPSAAPAKRRRTDAYVQGTRRNDLPDLQAERLSDSDDNELLYSSLFSADDANPVEAESPNFFEYAEGTAPPPATMPQTSQMTLVEINPLSSQSRPTFGGEPQMQRPRTPPENTAAVEDENGVHTVHSSRHTNTAQIHRSRQVSKAKAYIPPPPTSKGVEVSPIVSSVPAPQPLAAQKEARRQEPLAPAVAKTEAPYQNTRSRSRSVEPSVFLPRPAEIKKSSKRRKENASQLEPLHESGLEEDRVVPEAMATLDEERDVENLLVATVDTGGTNTPEMPGPEVETLPARVPDTRSKTFDTDDEQTRRDLHQGAKQPLPEFPTSNYTSIDPKEMLRRFAATLPTTPSSQQSSIRPLQQSLLARTRHGTSSASSSGPRITESTSQPRTPTRHLLQPRKKSTSSTESFPVAGTRASVVKKKYEQVEKRSPYKPPPGTRAAQYVLLR